MRFVTVAASMLLIGSIVFLNVTALAQAVDWGLKSGFLEEEMTEIQVMRVLGYRPNKVGLETCGVKSQNGSWACKVFTYGEQNRNLTILFRKSEGGWIVNNWFVEP